MPAYFDTGFSVRQPMWHGEGLVLDDYPTDWNDARKKAGLLWEPKVVPSYHAIQPAPCPACFAMPGQLHHDECPDFGLLVPSDPCFVEADGQRLVVRDDTEKALGSVSDGFGLVYHSTMGEILEAVLDQAGGALKFETAGSCKGGAQVWAIAYLDEPTTVAGDDTETYPFLALLNSHDGSGACKLVMTSVRVVCWNTYQAASMQGERTGRQFTFRHTAKVLERVEEAKAALSGLREEHAAWTKMAEELGLLTVDERALNHFIADFIPEPPADVVSSRVRDNIDQARTIFRSMYLDSPTTDGHRGTALGLVDTAVEYLDHVRGYRNSDTYMGRTLLRSEPLKAKAVTLARTVCGA